MESEENPTLLSSVDRQVTLVDMLRTTEETCRSCKQQTPITCISGCKNWKLKNQFRKLHEKTKNPNFMINLLNTLKNKRRLHVLETISKRHCSTTQLQRELRKLGFKHSQQTIIEEYVNPLITVGLAEEHQNLFHATLFGQRTNDLTKDFHDLEDTLSPHSECYEETTLGALMKEPRTHERLEEIIPEKSVPRVLSRLQRAALAETCIKRDYVFFFTTRRDPNGSCFSPTEKRVYEGIPIEGISARRLAGETGISVRRTYKYLRRLKGKKLVFMRKRPISYTITVKGVKIGTMLEGIHNLAAEASAATERVLEGEHAGGHVAEDAEQTSKRRRNGQAVTLPTTEPLRQNGCFSEDSRDPRIERQPCRRLLPFFCKSGLSKS